MVLRDVSLDDKYTTESGEIFLTGIQALVRLPLMQHERDRSAGYRTAGFITGYRGSPLGSFDQQLAAARSHLERCDVHFLPAVNEDLAATALWGTQQANIGDGGLFDGVFGMWYGKGPGVDRSGDALRHSNLAGTSRLGGVLALMGDDHTCESSTTSHQSEYAMVDAMIPIFNPAGVQDILDFGLMGWAMSRYSGCWVGMKCVHDTVESSASVCVSPERALATTPEAPFYPNEGLGIRWPDPPQEQEKRLHELKLDAVLAFARSNVLDQVVMDSPIAKIGILTTGKSYLDLRRALQELDIDEAEAARLGIRLYKVAMSWPLEPSGVRAFAKGLEQVIVVEEKRGLMEDQLTSILYPLPDRPQVVGKKDENGRWLFPSAGRLDPSSIALEVGRRILGSTSDPRLEVALAALETRLAVINRSPAPLARTPYFCAGCPHNTSTRLPEGSEARAGIGCHYMVQWMDRSTERYTQMGGEGANWIGESRFSERDHIFQNIGDGTYYHSGLLAIRACVAAGVNMTFKVLFNDAVAMTGGQGMDGPLDPIAITRQVYAEGVRHIAVVSEAPEQYAKGLEWAPGVRIHHRRELMSVQRTMRTTAGVSVIVYDQTCAAEKRRRRRRQIMEDPPRRLFINEAVCEGCGDCGKKSNCVGVVPVQTPLGVKRAIDQSACNKDYTCLDGFCPSFVSVIGGALKRGLSGHVASHQVFEDPPDEPSLARPYGILLTGVGGTGVVTASALIGMAAHLEKKGCSVLDMAGLAQKGGAVTSHVIVARTRDEISATHVADAGADLLLGGDLVVSASEASLLKVRPGLTRSLVNAHPIVTGEFVADPDRVFPADALKERLVGAVGPEKTTFIDTHEIAVRHLGDAIFANVVLLGAALQSGLLPVTAPALERAIELNGRDVDRNLAAFRLGRRAVSDGATQQSQDSSPEHPQSLEAFIDYRYRYLLDYQNRRYADRYRSLVDRVIAKESSITAKPGDLSWSVASAYFHLLAYKDEYEVSRLLTSKKFLDRMSEVFEGDYALRFHLAPPAIARYDPETGEPRKIEFGQWIVPVLRLVSRCRFLRGTPFDPFGFGKERKMERTLAGDYEEMIVSLLESANESTLEKINEIASLPLQIRGFGHVKASAYERYRLKQQQCLDQLAIEDSVSRIVHDGRVTG